jgi:hypothetical protein
MPFCSPALRASSSLRSLMCLLDPSVTNLLLRASCCAYGVLARRMLTSIARLSSTKRKRPLFMYLSDGTCCTSFCQICSTASELQPWVVREVVGVWSAHVSGSQGLWGAGAAKGIVRAVRQQ